MKNLFEISSEEKQRILELYLGNTKRTYLFEQLKKINIKVTDGKDPVPSAAIIDSGDKSNGVITNINGEATLDNFTGPNLLVTITGFINNEVTPNSENVTVTLKPSDTELGTLNVVAKPIVNIKIIDSETKKPIEGVKVTIEKGETMDDPNNEVVKLYTDKKGIFKFDFNYYLADITITKDGYNNSESTIVLDNTKSKNDPYMTIELEEIVEVPDELTYLIGKVFRFLDSNMKKPGWFKILGAEYVEDRGKTTTLLKTGYCQTQNDCESDPSFTIIYDCDRVAFKVQKISDEWSRKVIDFVVKNYLYCRDLQNYLFSNTKNCTLNKP
jgi:hypothetical protein